MRYVILLVSIVVGMIVYLRMGGPPNAVRYEYADSLNIEGAIKPDGTYSFAQVKIGDSQTPVTHAEIYIRTTKNQVLNATTADRVALLNAGGTPSGRDSWSGLKTSYILIDDASFCQVNGKTVFVDIANSRGRGCGIGASH
ncbi:MAG: hypothetical protein ABIF71_00635 [Planctomycetota bacterium]